MDVSSRRPSSAVRRTFSWWLRGVADRGMEKSPSAAVRPAGQRCSPTCTRTPPRGLVPVAPRMRTRRLAPAGSWRRTEPVRTSPSAVDGWPSVPAWTSRTSPAIRGSAAAPCASARARRTGTCQAGAGPGGDGAVPAARTRAPGTGLAAPRGTRRTRAPGSGLPPGPRIKPLTGTGDRAGLATLSAILSAPLDAGISESEARSRAADEKTVGIRIRASNKRAAVIIWDTRSAVGDPDNRVLRTVQRIIRVFWETSLSLQEAFLDG